jgi:hypothetical protein
MQFGIIQNVWQKLYTYGVSLDAMNTEAYLVLPDLHSGFDNYKHYLYRCQNQNNYLSFTHLLSSRRAWAKGRAEPEGGKLFQKQIVFPILLITSGFGVVFRFDPRQEVQIKPLVAAGGFISSLAKLTMRLASTVIVAKFAIACSSYKQPTNLCVWREDVFPMWMVLQQSTRSSKLALVAMKRMTHLSRLPDIF